jgi:hypothetical protein
MLFLGTVGDLLFAVLRIDERIKKRLGFYPPARRPGLKA